MKNGKTLMELATELERQAAAKKDYLADSRKMSFEVAKDDSIILQGINGGMALRATAHDQMAASLAIPKVYYQKMMTEAPDLLARNANHWLQAQPMKKLVRTLDGHVRAVLSDSYRPLDNLDLAEAVLPKLIGMDAQVVSSEITESRLYLKAVTEKISGEVAKGDVIQAGVIVSNSEIGHGSLRVEALDFRLVCLNGMIREHSIRKAHLGRNRGEDAIEDAREFFRDETRIADDRAFFLKVQDATAAMFDAVRFAGRIEQYKAAAERQIEKDPITVVEVTAKKYGMIEKERTGVLLHLMKGGSLTQWGLANAVTRMAQDVGSYDRSVELEKFGGNIVELPQSDWKVLAL